MNWAALANNIRPETNAAVNAFRRRHTELVTKLGALKEMPQKIDFAHYSAVLQNKRVVMEAQKSFESYRPATLDLSQQLKIISEAQVSAVAAAKQTQDQISNEVSQLKTLLKNIETARPIAELTVEDVAEAYPELDATVEKMVKRGQWRVPGYYEKFGEFVVGF